MNHVTIKDTTVTKATIAKNINQEIGLSKEDSASIIDDILNEIKTSLAKDGIVKISSFGTFLVKKKKERPGNIPNTSEKVMIQARSLISFRPSKIIKKLINN
ncbi:integration host factor subunit alpha [Wolbachia endosymbiont of Drosophila tsacasi]|uniref:integration host factor subunit alpha n=1 Tax=Wolbachia endosymbiont of Drosophila tsacasi TaxID=3002579 RepID=UPI0023A928C4|nr:integration host factor subunit alpha [Wolbachia endosymbiont of Drosophila tsacasi]MDE5062671.1 integration host factor subunit alpha [Wolbachia endosymbiont of Drosophila tsacasi]